MKLAAQVISGLAHDFSNLLTIILGLQSRLARLDALPAPAAPLIEGTLAAARRGGALLSTIADMTGARTLRPHRDAHRQPAVRPEPAGQAHAAQSR